MAFALGALGRVLSHVGTLLLLRADLAAEELSLARAQVLGWLLAALAGVMLLEVALIAFGGWLTVVLWDRFGAGTLGVLALVLAVSAGLMLRWLMHAARTAEALLVRTRSALHDDYEVLASTVASGRAGPPPS